MADSNYDNPASTASQIKGAASSAAWAPVAAAALPVLLKAARPILPSLLKIAVLAAAGAIAFRFAASPSLETGVRRRPRMKRSTAPERAQYPVDSPRAEPHAQENGTRELAETQFPVS